MEESQVFSADQAQAAPPVGSPTTPAPPPQPPLAVPTEAQEWIGDGKKYKSVDDALKAVPHAQSHIKTLEQELADARAELAKRKAAEDLLNEIKQASTPQQATPASVEADPEVLSQIVEQVLEKKTAQNAAQQNAKSVIDKFTAVYGEKAKDQYFALASNSGMSIQDLDTLSMKSPSAVLKLAGIDSKQQTTGKLQSDVAIPTQSHNNTAASIIPRYATTKDLVNAFKATEQRVLAQHKGQ